ncbi:MAG: CHASE2 domain-containing protein, partial [Burkholderiales bacterium]|nr:CHASE2 domain-containing protein [Burkholderiales bacterium]
MRRSQLPHWFDSPLKWMRWGIAVLAVLLTVSIESLPSGKYSWFGNEWLRDQFILWHAQETPETRFAVIDIDEASLAEIGRWPWSRAHLADMVEQILGPYGARGVALDMVLSEPADEAGDTRLAMLSRFGPVVLAQAFDYEGNLPLRVGQLIAPQHPQIRPAFVLSSGYIANNARLAHSDAKAGNIGLVPDRDGMIRRLPLYTRYEQNLYPGLALTLMQCCNGPQAGKFKMQASDNGFWRIPYRRTWSAYTVIPASYILQQKIPVGLLENRLVLVGSSALGLSDRVATPLSPNSSGLLVHAAALSAMLDQQAGIGPTPWPGKSLAILYSLALAALASWIFPRWSALANVSFL